MAGRAGKVASCQKCRTYKHCIGKPFYLYHEIRWCPYQIIWIWENREDLLIGVWPDNPDGSQSVDPGAKAGYRTEASYVKAASILGETEVRLNATGKAGEALIKQISGVIVVKEGKNAKIKGLDFPAYRALMYAKGKRRKMQSFKIWQKERERREKRG